MGRIIGIALLPSAGIYGASQNAVAAGFWLVIGLVLTWYSIEGEKKKTPPQRVR